MQSSKTFPKPTNWQDFETLCKKLWGEIWQCPEIKKNGRSGQHQSGVDIYGIPRGFDMYFGIQCKLKDEHTNKKLTESEIISEINKAREFEPKLQKLYFATTADKDTKIEEFIRQQNLKNKSEGIFEIHIFSWEDIVELIYENEQTYKWYAESRSFHTTKSAEVTFENGENEIIMQPQFIEKRTLYRLKEFEEKNNSATLYDFFKKMQPQYSNLAPLQFEKSKINHSFIPFKFRIFNKGTEPIREFKLEFNIGGEVEDISDSNIIHEKFNVISKYQKIKTIFLNRENKSGIVESAKLTLVGDDTFISDNIFIKPKQNISPIFINWKLLSETFKKEGRLIINFKPQNKVRHNIIYVNDSSKIKETLIEFEDFIQEID